MTSNAYKAFLWLVKSYFPWMLCIMNSTSYLIILVTFKSLRVGTIRVVLASLWKNSIKDVDHTKLNLKGVSNVNSEMFVMVFIIAKTIATALVL